MADIAIRGVTKQYPNGHVAVDGVDLDVADGELLVLVGPSGCGKSTLLRMVAGLEEVTDRARSPSAAATSPTPRRRTATSPWSSRATPCTRNMTVRGNIGYPLKLAKRRAGRDRPAGGGGGPTARSSRPSSTGGRRSSPAASASGWPWGGPSCASPRAFLMDEPLSNLDAKLRVQMRAEIARLQRDLGVTTIYVTHDQVEAMTMGSRVAVLHGGRIQQVDTPRALYERPGQPVRGQRSSARRP